MSRAGWSSAQRPARRGSWQNTHRASGTLAKVPAGVLGTRLRAAGHHWTGPCEDLYFDGSVFISTNLETSSLPTLA